MALNYWPPLNDTNVIKLNNKSVICKKCLKSFKINDRIVSNQVVGNRKARTNYYHESCYNKTLY